jgi:cytochrome c-type biogenesis protein CcmH/NrfF
MDKSGMSAEQILDAFVAEYGEKALMAPKPQGFNLWGYLLPGSLILAAGAGLFAFITRRRVTVAGAPAAEPGATPGADSPPGATPEEMERLRQALAEVDD